MVMGDVRDRIVVILPVIRVAFTSQACSVVDAKSRG